MQKTVVVGALDERGLLIAERLHRALEANERAKYYCSLVQLARAHADSPESAVADLAADRKRAGIEEVDLDRVVERSAALGGNAYRIPGARKIFERALSDVKAMIDPLLVDSGGEDAPAAEALMRRVHAIAGAFLGIGPDRVTGAAIARMTGAERGAQDSLHLLVMDAHKVLLKLESRLAVDTIGGAKVYGLTKEDRPFVLAFTEGVERTAKLKFDHPGLETTATRYAGHLVLENDIGATDAHVVVVHVEATRVVVTATDVHVQRLEFLQKLLESFAMRWDDLRARRAPTLNAGEAFYVCVGTFEAPGPDAIRALLAHLGSSLVFLIDWNRARKALQCFVSKPDALKILLCAAREAIGHRAFLEAGGDRLLFDAMAAILRAPVRFGERLDDVLGKERAVAFLGFVLREATEARLQGRSRALLRERVHAELATALVEAGDRLLAPLLRHAIIVRDLSSSVGDAIRGLVGRQEVSSDLSREAKGREREADEIVVETRSVVERISGTLAFKRIVEAADDAADALEDATFQLTLLPADASLRARACSDLLRLAQIVQDSTVAYVDAIEGARRASSLSERARVQGFLDAVERVLVQEREADGAEREILVTLMGTPCADARWLVLSSTIAHELEAATDALALAALCLRDHVTGTSTNCR